MKRILIFLITIIFIFASFKHGYIKNIRITSYYPNDSTNSKECTASGYCTKDFTLNNEGMYTFNGKIVIATPTYKCTSLKTGVCKKYNSLPKGYHQYSLHDEIKLTFNNKQYDAIVLDICGACYWDEELQRYDIFVQEKKYVIDTYGTTYIKTHINFYLLSISIILIVLLLILIIKKKLSINLKRHT